MAITRRPNLLLPCLMAFALTACADQGAAPDEAKGGGDPELQTTLAPPAPEGELALNVETLAEGLVNPWSIAFLPDGTMLVSERPGRIRIIRGGALAQDPVAGVPEVYVGGQAGLFDILPHPNFADNNLLYLAYAHGTAKENGLRVARARFDGETLGEIEVLYDAKPLKDTNHHFGGRLLFGPDGKLYFSVGEGSRYKERAQVMSTSFGAIIRLNDDGSIPEDNAEFDKGLPELWTKGHRNPQGLAYDPARDIIWATEHGPRGGDEVNIIEKGANYGWPLASYGIDYNGARITPFTEYEGMKQPFKYWTPSLGASGLTVYYGDIFPEDWRGDLLVGAMATLALHRVDLEGMEEVGEERYLIGERVRDVRTGPDGAVYVLTDDHGGAPVGKVLRLTPQ